MSTNGVYEIIYFKINNIDKFNNIDNRPYLKIDNLDNIDIIGL